MAGFINFEADVEGTYVDEVSNISDSDSLKSFIDNEEVQQMLVFINILLMLKLILNKD